MSLKVIEHDTVYEPLTSSRVMLDLFAANMKTVGLSEGEPIPDRLGSSDIGNVSQVVPAIQPMIGIAPTGMAIHTRDFADAAVKPLARAGPRRRRQDHGHDHLRSARGACSRRPGEGGFRQAIALP